MVRLLERPWECWTCKIKKNKKYEKRLELLQVYSSEYLAPYVILVLLVLPPVSVDQGSTLTGCAFLARTLMIWQVSSSITERSSFPSSTCKQVYLHVWIHIWMYVCMYVCIYVYTYIYVRIHTCVHTHTHIHILTYIYICLQVDEGNGARSNLLNSCIYIHK